ELLPGGRHRPRPAGRPGHRHPFAPEDRDQRCHPERCIHARGSRVCRSRGYPDDRGQLRTERGGRRGGGPPHPDPPDGTQDRVSLALAPSVTETAIVALSVSQAPRTSGGTKRANAREIVGPGVSGPAGHGKPGCAFLRGMRTLVGRDATRRYRTKSRCAETAAGQSPPFWSVSRVRPRPAEG